MAAFGPNEWLVDELYQQYLQDRNSVDEAWWEFFADYRRTGGGNGADPDSGRAADPASGTHGHSPPGSGTAVPPPAVPPPAEPATAVPAAGASAETQPFTAPAAAVRGPTPTPPASKPATATDTAKAAPRPRDIPRS